MFDRIQKHATAAFAVTYSFCIYIVGSFSYDFLEDFMSRHWALIEMDNVFISIGKSCFARVGESTYKRYH